MAAPRTAGIIVVALLNVLIGLAAGAGSVRMIVDALRASGASSGGLVPAAAGLSIGFGAARLVLGAELVVAGAGVFRIAPWGRTLSLWAASFWLVLNLVEPAVLHYSYAQVLIGSIYPLILVSVCSSPGWKRAFTAPAAPGTA